MGDDEEENEADLNSSHFVQSGGQGQRLRVKLKKELR
jgi:hypothetical protein